MSSMQKDNNNNMKDLTFAFIGTGNMSGAILAGLIKSGINPKQIIATNRSAEKQQRLAERYAVITDLSNQQAVKQADVIILGVKPQMMTDVLTSLVNQQADFNNKLVITVAAGLPCKKYTDILGNIRLIRSMPNTPSLLGMGMTGLFLGSDPDHFNSEVLIQDTAVASYIFNAVGKSLWLQDEQEIDKLTAISGSGPAYFFLFMENMIKTAESMGFTRKDAELMVKQTALGAANMAVLENDEEKTNTTSESLSSIEQLRIKVTSPGGSTAKAIASFEQQDLAQVVDTALNAALQRNIEMSNL